MSKAGSLALVIVGCLLLAANLGWLRLSQVAALLETWWPLVLIIAGLIGLFVRKR